VNTQVNGAKTMGWTCHSRPLRHETPVQFVTKEFSHEDDGTKTTVLAAAAVRGAIYAAIRHEDKRGGGSYVLCAVILFRNNKRDGFSYKAMDETMGPCKVDCPDRIMRLLSPVSEIPTPCFAADWRQRVIATRAQRTALASLMPGAHIKLQHPVSFRGGISADRFTLVGHHKRTPVFAPVAHPAFACCLPEQALMTATIED
jgi:hypothetical protein